MSVSAHVNSDPESRQFQQLEANLVAAFSPPLRPEEVERCLMESRAAYESARVRTYLAVLVGRDVTERLRDLSRSRPDARDRARPMGALP